MMPKNKVKPPISSRGISPKIPSKSVRRKNQAWSEKRIANQTKTNKKKGK